MIYFLLMSRHFRKCWHAIKRGDRVLKDHIENEWIREFYSLNKHNCAKTFLSRNEIECSKISYNELMLARINSLVRRGNSECSKRNPYLSHVFNNVVHSING